MNPKLTPTIEEYRQREKCNANWYHIWRYHYDKAHEATKSARRAADEADRVLSIRIARDVGMTISPTAAKRWRQACAKGWASNDTKCKAEIPPITALGSVPRPESDDPIPATLWLALLCFAMELCDYTIPQICEAVGKKAHEVVALIDYARTQEHAWREEQTRAIINAARTNIARGKRNLIDDRIAANPEPQEVQL